MERNRRQDIKMMALVLLYTNSCFDFALHVDLLLAFDLSSLLLVSQCHRRVCHGTC